VVWLTINTTQYMNKQANQKWISQHQLSYPILDDHLGEVGKLYGAKTTPHMYIIDKSGKLVYQGAIDDDPRGAKKESAVNYVEKALDEVLAGKPVSVSQTKPYGCTVKYAD
jgi:peroxiredoxin